MKKIFNSEWTPLIFAGIIFSGFYLFGKGKFEYTDNIFQFIIGSGLIVWLFQKTIDSFLTKRFESYKNELNIKSIEHKLELDKDLKEYESKLNLFINKSNHLHLRRLDILSELYQKLVLLNRKMVEMTRLLKLVSPGEDAEISEKERIKSAGMAYNDFSDYFDKNKIYFSKDLCVLIQKLQEEFWSSFHDYTFPINFGLPSSEMTYKLVRDAANKIDKDVPKILETIEMEFRKLIGVFDENEMCS
jgi:hypothetical protein